MPINQQGCTWISLINYRHLVATFDLEPSSKVHIFLTSFSPYLKISQLAKDYFAAFISFNSLIVKTRRMQNSMSKMVWECYVGSTGWPCMLLGILIPQHVRFRMFSLSPVPADCKTMLVTTDNPLCFLWILTRPNMNSSKHWNLLSLSSAHSAPGRKAQDWPTGFSIP